MSDRLFRFMENFDQTKNMTQNGWKQIQPTIPTKVTTTDLKQKN